jgi:DNA (cytosine-5)-methyltransferase 1
VKYLSVCSGIEAASVAWEPLGWEPLAFSEIEPFPRAVLEHHYPQVPLHGDFTVLRHEPWIADADVLVGGTPCQAFSVAGLRKSLGDDRGNLSLEFIRLADSIDAAREAQGRDPSIVVWENVPGVLSVRDNAFGCFLSGLSGEDTPFVPPRGKWTNAGVALGPARAVAWRILDAQFFGVAQRRRRIFVLGVALSHPRARAIATSIFPLAQGVRRDTPPRREAGQVAPTIPARSTAGGGLGTDFDCDGGVIRAVAMEDPVPPLMARSSRGGAQTLSPGHQTDGHMVAVPYWRGGDQANSELLADMAGTLNCNKGQQGGVLFDVTHSLRAEGFDASEDGTGRGTPLVPVAIPVQEVGKRTGTSTTDPRAGIGIGEDGDPMYTLQAGAQHGVAAYAFQPRIARNGRGDMGDLVNALNAQSGETGKGDAAPCVATVYSIMPQNSGRDYKARPVEVAQPIMAGGPVGGNQGGDYVQQHMAVRRLTPVECERLQGFPDDYTMISWKKKPADQCPDGPRYKALGNSMAVPCMHWIGRRIAEALR